MRQGHSQLRSWRVVRSGHADNGPTGLLSADVVSQRQPVRGPVYRQNTVKSKQFLNPCTKPVVDSKDEIIMDTLLPCTKSFDVAKIDRLQSEPSVKLPWAFHDSLSRSCLHGCVISSSRRVS